MAELDMLEVDCWVEQFGIIVMGEKGIFFGRKLCITAIVPVAAIREILSP
jgi:hypothetical protein